MSSKQASITNQIAPGSKKNKFYKSLKPLSIQINNKAVSKQSNTRNTLSTINNESSSNQISPIARPNKKILSKPLNYSTINTSTSTSINNECSFKPKPKTPSSYQSKQAHKFLINKIKEPVSTKNADVKPFKAMFSSFDISKEAESLEEDGNNSYDYFKNFYSQIIIEKQLEAENKENSSESKYKKTTVNKRIKSNNKTISHEYKSSIVSTNTNNTNNTNNTAKASALTNRRHYSTQIYNANNTSITSNTTSSIVNTNLIKATKTNNSIQPFKRVSNYKISMNTINTGDNCKSGSKSKNNKILNITSKTKEEYTIKVRANSKLNTKRAIQTSTAIPKERKTVPSTTCNSITAALSKGKSSNTKTLFSISKNTNDRMRSYLKKKTETTTTTKKA